METCFRNHLELSVVLRKGTNRLQIAFLCFRTKQRYNITAVWKMLTNRELVVAWQLLEAVPSAADEGWHSPKGLTAQWLSTVREFVQR